MKTSTSNFVNSNLDMTIGAAVATLIGSILRANDIVFGAEQEVAVGLLIVAVMARLGVTFTTKKADDA